MKAHLPKFYYSSKLSAISRTVAWQYGLKRMYTVGGGKNMAGTLKKFNYYDDNIVVNLTSEYGAASGF